MKINFLLNYFISKAEVSNTHSPKHAPHSAYPIHNFILVWIRVHFTQKKAFEKTGTQYQIQVSGTYTFPSYWGLCPLHPSEIALRLGHTWSSFGPIQIQVLNGQGKTLWVIIPGLMRTQDQFSLSFSFFFFFFRSHSIVVKHI